MKVQEKIVYNSHTHKIIGFEKGALDIDVLKGEFEALGLNNDNSEETKRLRSVAKHILLFMIRRWDKVGDSLKLSVARYSVGSSNGVDITRKIMMIICALSIRSLIVNQIARKRAK